MASEERRAAATQSNERETEREIARSSEKPYRPYGPERLELPPRLNPTLPWFSSAVPRASFVLLSPSIDQSINPFNRSLAHTHTSALPRSWRCSIGGGSRTGRTRGGCVIVARFRPLGALV